MGGTVGTPFRLEQEGALVATGVLGGEPLRLVPGAYTLHVEGRRPFEAPVRVESGERLTVTLEVEGERATPRETREPVEYVACEDGGPTAEAREANAPEADAPPPGASGG